MRFKFFIITSLLILYLTGCASSSSSSLLPLEPIPYNKNPIMVMNISEKTASSRGENTFVEIYRSVYSGFLVLKMTYKNLSSDKIIYVRPEKMSVIGYNAVGIMRDFKVYSAEEFFKAKKKFGSSEWAFAIGWGKTLYDDLVKSIELKPKEFVRGLVLVKMNPDYSANIDITIPFGNEIHKIVLVPVLNELSQMYGDISTTNPHVYYNQGNSFYNLGDDTNAKANYEKTIELNPDYAAAYNRLGIIYATQGNLSHAINLWEKAIGLMPNYSEFHYNLGLGYAKSNPDKALVYYRQAAILEDALAKPPEKSQDSEKKEEPVVEESVGFEIPPKPLTPIRPIFPEIAQMAGIEGMVVVQAFIDEEGNIKETEILKSVPGLNQAATNSIISTKFKPALDDGNPIGVWISIPVNFKFRKE